MGWTWKVGGVAAVGLGAVLAGGAHRARHEAGLDPLWRELTQPTRTSAGPTPTFQPGMVEGLPAPARRYLLRAIRPGTPIARSVELRMRGSFRLKPGADTVPMEAEQVLSSAGYIWRARVGAGAMRIRGYDRFVHGSGEMRWWVLGVVPVVHGSGPDFDRSAAGRLAAEALSLPSLFLPSEGAVWEAVDDSTARVRLPRTGQERPVSLVVDAEGRPVRLWLDRWNGDPANGPVGWLRFGADGFTTEGTFDGYTIPTRMRGGWRLGEPDEFDFFRAEMTAARFR